MSGYSLVDFVRDYQVPRVSPPPILDQAGLQVWELVERLGQGRRPSNQLASQPPGPAAGLAVDIPQVLDVGLGDGRDSVQEVAAGEVTLATVADNSGGPVEGESLEVDLDTGEQEVVVGVGGVEDAASAGDRNNVDVERGIDDQGDLGGSEGLAVDLVANLGGKLEEGRLDVTPVPRVVDEVLAGHVD